MSNRADRAALATRSREELRDALDALLGERLRLTEKRPRDGAGWVDVSAHDLATTCPARWSVPADDFVTTAATVAGSVGRLALRDRNEREPVPEAVRRILAGLEDVDPDAAWFAPWYLDELDRSARAAIRAAATTWALSALAAVDGRTLTWATRRQPADVAERMIRLRTSWDASSGGARPDVLLVMTTRSLHDPVVELLAGFNALADGLLRRVVPARVRVGSAAEGTTVAVSVTEGLLRGAVDRVVELVGWRIDPDSAQTRPGPWCAHCHLLEICPDASTDGAGRLSR